MCDKTSCPKSYHLACLKLKDIPRGKWTCPWHHCDECGKTATQNCDFCPCSYCAEHKMSFRNIRGKPICPHHEEEGSITPEEEGSVAPSSIEEAEAPAGSESADVPEEEDEAADQAADNVKKEEPTESAPIAKVQEMENGTSDNTALGTQQNGKSDIKKEAVSKENGQGKKNEAAVPSPLKETSQEKKKADLLADSEGADLPGDPKKNDTTIIIDKANGILDAAKPEGIESKEELTHTDVI